MTMQALFKGEFQKDFDTSDFVQSKDKNVL